MVELASKKSGIVKSDVAAAISVIPLVNLISGPSD